MTDQQKRVDEPERGDWVLVRALVDRVDMHPEEIRVQMRSHNEDFLANVLRTNVLGVTAPPDDWPRCRSATAQEVTGVHPQPVRAILQCTRSSQHGGLHEAPSLVAEGLIKWSPEESDIYVEEG